jgi:hypothetical protein
MEENTIYAITYSKRSRRLFLNKRQLKQRLAVACPLSGNPTIEICNVSQDCITVIMLTGPSKVLLEVIQDTSETCLGKNLEFSRQVFPLEIPYQTAA